MAAAQREDRGKPRRRLRAGGVLAVLIAAWLAGRGFMAGRGAAPAAGAALAGGAAADANRREPTPAVGASPSGESKAAEPAAVPAPAPPEIAADRIAALCDAALAEIARGDLGATADALRRARLAAPGIDDTAEYQAADAAARAMAVASCGEAIALLQQGRAISAQRRLFAFAPTSRHADAALALLPEPLQAAARARLGARLRIDASAPAPRPLARGRVVTAWLAGAPVVGTCVASDAEQATLRVGRDDAVAFPTVPHAACEPHEPTAAEAVECGIAAVRAGDAALAASWLLVAELRGGGALERARRLADLLR